MNNEIKCYNEFHFHDRWFFFFFFLKYDFFKLGKRPKKSASILNTMVIFTWMITLLLSLDLNSLVLNPDSICFRISLFTATSDLHNKLCIPPSVSQSQFQCVIAVAHRAATVHRPHTGWHFLHVDPPNRVSIFLSRELKRSKQRVKYIIHTVKAAAGWGRLTGIVLGVCISPPRGEVIINCYFPTYI